MAAGTTWYGGGTTVYAATGAETSALVVPTGQFYRVRHIRIYNGNASPQGVQLCFGTFASGKFFRATSITIPNTGTEDIYCSFWLGPAASINAQAGVGGGLNLIFDYDIYV